MTPEHDLVARAAYNDGKRPVLVDVRCTAIYRGRTCGNQMARVLSTPRGPLFESVIDGGIVAGVEVPAITTLVLLEWPHEECNPVDYGEPVTVMGRCRRHVGDLVDRDALAGAVAEARRSGKVIVLPVVIPWRRRVDLS